MENHHAINRQTIYSISMGHLYRGYVSHNQMVDQNPRSPLCAYHENFPVA